MSEDMHLDTPEKMLGDIDDLIVDITNVQSQLEQFRNIESMRDLLRGELEDCRRELNQERQKNAELKEAIDGLITDMSLMEMRIAELTGTDDYGS